MRRQRPHWPPGSPPDPIYAQPRFPSRSPPSSGPPSIPSTSTETFRSFEEFRPVRIVAASGFRNSDPENLPKSRTFDRNATSNFNHSLSPGQMRMHRVAEGPNISVKVLSSKHKHNLILKWYSDLILEFPTTILIATLLLSLALPLSILHLYPLQLNENPEKVSIKDNLILL